MKLATFIKLNRGTIDKFIRQQVPGARIDNNERELWIMNDYDLYLWAKGEGVPLDD